MKKFLLLMFILTIGLAGCRKDNTTGSFAGNGSITGTMSPASIATQLHLVNTSGTPAFDAYIIPDANTGSFKLDNVPAGTYVLSFAFVSSIYSLYVAPDNKTVVVTAGQNTDTGVNTISSGGGISGLVYPVEAISGITAVNTTSSRSFSTTIDAISGSFVIKNLPPGTYTITFNPTSGYSVDSRTATITAGQYTNAGKITFTKSAGSISGTLSLPGSVASVTVVTYSSSVVYSIIPYANGNFKIGNLASGTYHLDFTAAAGNTLPLPYSRIITLAQSQNIDLGTLTLTSTVPPYPMACYIDGLACHTTDDLTGIYSSSQLKVSSFMSNGVTITIALNGVNGLGEYTCNSMTGSTITMVPALLGISLSDATWSTSNAGGSGTVKITAIDPVAKIVSGTFSATVINPNNKVSTITITKTITGGTFSVPYQ